MSTTPVSGVERRNHWDGRYRTVAADTLSWFEPIPRLSLALLDLGGIDPSSSVIDVGGGASSLARTLAARGISDITVLDISAEALEIARSGCDHPSAIDWIVADITEWEPTRTWNLWHDRAVFHFLTEASQRDAYREQLDRALASGGAVCIATFASDGPAQCSGLDVAHYTPEELSTEIGLDLHAVGMGRHLHTTPSGAVQPFSWIVATR